MNVAVIIPAFNQGAYLPAALDSALAQSHHPSQIIVVDDGSSDDTRDICAHYGSRIEYSWQPNAGPSAARNCALQRCDADAVVFLDADDVLADDWLSQAVRHGLSEIDRGAKLGIVYGDYLLFDDRGGYEQKVSVDHVTLNALVRDSLLVPSGTFVTRDCLCAVGAFNSELDTCEDWDYWLRATFHGYTFAHVPRIAFRRREHVQSASKREWSALQRRIKFLQHWLKSTQLSAAQQLIMRDELFRTLLRLRRCAHFIRQPTQPYVEQALALNSAGVMDPWCCTYAAVYAAPFFRKQYSRGERQRAINTVRDQLLCWLTTHRQCEASRVRRIRASAWLAHAADALLDRDVLRASYASARACATDVTLLRALLGRNAETAAEWRRVRHAIS